MNIAKIMIPKISTVFLHEKDTIRQGLERFMVHGYTAVPVLNDQEQYIGSVTEGDFLRHLLVCQTTDLKVQEGYRLGSIVRRDFCSALQIDADSEQVVRMPISWNLSVFATMMYALWPSATTFKVHWKQLLCSVN